MLTPLLAHPSRPLSVTSTCETRPAGGVGGDVHRELRERHAGPVPDDAVRAFDGIAETDLDARLQLATLEFIADRLQQGMAGIVAAADDALRKSTADGLTTPA